MGMKKAVKEATSVTSIPPVPPVPSVKEQLAAAKTIQAVDKVRATIEKAGDDKGLSDRMTKQDWSNKDRAIERVALMKSVLESPVLGQRVIGLNQADAFKEFEAWFNKAVEVFYSK